MKKTFNFAELAKLTLSTASVLVLTACLDSDDDSAPLEEEHEHTLFISQSNDTALSFVEEEDGLEEVGDAADVGSRLLLADNGEAAAVITAGSVEFVVAHEEEHEGEEEEAEEEHEAAEISSLSVTGSDIEVINSYGHFSMLVGTTTQLVAYEALEGEAPDSEPLDYSLTETYPALVLHEDETHGLLAVAFAGGNATVYEGSTEEGTSAACSAVSSSAQYGEFALVACENSTISVKVEEVNGEHEVEIAPVAGISTSVNWKARAGVFVGLGEDANIYIREIKDEALVVEDTFSVADSVDDICGWGIDSVNADIFVLTAGTLTAYDHEGTATALTLDESNNPSCSDLVMTTANEVVYVIDNAASKLYEIDIEDEGGEPAYHIHERIDLDVNDVASAVSFHDVGSEDGHSH